MKIRTAISLSLAGVALAGVIASVACKHGGPTDPPPPSSLSFSGSVTSGGVKLSGVKIYLSGDASKTAETDGNGAFSFTNLTGSSFVVTPSLVNTAFVPARYELTAQSRNDLTFAAQTPTYGSTIGQLAADFTALNQQGTMSRLYDSFGKVVLIDFSADWCGPCQSEAGSLESLSQAYKDKGLVVLTILISGSTATWATTYGLTFPVLDDTAQTLWAIYGEGYIPLNIVLDRNMGIRYKTAGFSEAEVRAAIEKLL